MRNAKEYLSQIRRYDTMIDSMLDEVDSLYAMVTRITPVLKDDVVSGSGQQDKMGNAIAKIVDLKERINRDIDNLVDMKQEASTLLAKVSNPDHFKVLHKRYILYETFEQIALDMNYSYRWICKLHGRALQAFGKILQEEEKNG